jgi:hypothetical protein
VTPKDLKAVRTRRILATAAVQTVQRLMHRGLVVPILEGRRMSPPKAVLALLHRVPQLTAVPAT